MAQSRQSQFQSQSSVDCSFRSGTSYPAYYPQANESSHFSQYLNHDNSSRVLPKESEEKDLSLRSVSTTKTASKIQGKLNFDLSPPIPEGNTPGSDSMRTFENIERILKNENENLRKQNELLLREVYKLKQNNYRYKEEYRNSRLEAEVIRLECEAQKKRAEEMKDIIMNRLMELEIRVNSGVQDFGGGLSIGECDSILEILTFSESSIK